MLYNFFVKVDLRSARSVNCSGKQEEFIANKLLLVKFNLIQ